jgi:hypothetical protein
MSPDAGYIDKQRHRGALPKSRAIFKKPLGTPKGINPCSLHCEIRIETISGGRRTRGADALATRRF